MKVSQWNVSKKSDPMSGVKRYEDELFTHITKLFPAIKIEREVRKEGKFSGNMPISWFLRPPGKGSNIVHATFQTFAPIALFRKPHKFVVTVNDLIPMLYPSTIRDISTRLQWIFTPRALKKVDHVIAISEFVKLEIIRLLGIDKGKITVVYDGVDHSAYRPLNQVECKSKFKLNLSEKHVLVVASNEEHKRMDLVVKVYDEIKKQRSDIKLIKIGYGQALKGEGIISPGWVDESDMPALFGAADVFLHTAEYEGFGMPVLEAMACGTPVVASLRASIPEIVGDCGTLINLESEYCVQNFAQAILNKIDKGKDLPAVERSKLFVWEKTAHQTVEVYRKLLGSV